MKAYKIVERDGADYKTLFHGLNGSRTIEPGVWLKADKKMVKDGTSKTTYLSGWHVLPSYEDCVEYMKKFTKRLDKLAIVECEVKETRPKEHSPSPVLLADYMRLEA